MGKIDGQWFRAFVFEYATHISGAGTGEARGATGPPPQYFADQLTLFEPGRADYPQLLLLAPPMFFTFRHHW